MFRRLTVPLRSLCTTRFYGVKSRETELTRQLKAKIAFSGPITVADYMREVLTNPVHGYYTTKRNILGEHGDFVTSPEISQMFGEMVGIWFLSEWMKLGKPKMQFVELGPGRGTLSSDVLKVFSQFGLQSHISLHLIEISSEFIDIQRKLLLQNGNSHTSHGIPVSWHKSLDEIPSGFTCFLAHEFFDALPVHVFRRTDAGWREVLVDVDESVNGPHPLRFVLARNDTPAVFAMHGQKFNGDIVEVSLDGIMIVRKLAKRIEEDGGFALIVDYGHNGLCGDTLRSFRGHKVCDPLFESGESDLTADVDFAQLGKAAADKCLVYGPTKQADFLLSMGIQHRLQKLCASCRPELADHLQSGYDMLINPNEMGGKFQFFALFPLVVKEYLISNPVAGFSPLETDAEQN